MLLVMTGTNVAQPTPTPTCATPPHPNGMWGILEDQGGALGPPSGKQKHACQCHVTDTWCPPPIQNFKTAPYSQCQHH